MERSWQLNRTCTANAPVVCWHSFAASYHVAPLRPVHAGGSPPRWPRSRRPSRSVAINGDALAELGGSQRLELVERARPEP